MEVGGGQEFCCEAASNAFFHYFRGRAGDSITAIGFGSAKYAEEGSPYFLVWSPENHKKFNKSDRGNIELVYIAATLRKGSFGSISEGLSLIF